MLRTLIVDDEPLAIARMVALCGDLPEIEVVATASDGASALDAVEAFSPDLLLLDIAMPGMSGLGVARALERLDRRPGIVFCTARDDHAIDAFEVAAVDYLLKPVTPDRLARAVARASQAVDRAAPPAWLDELWVPHRDEMIRLSVTDIDRLEAERDYVRIVSGRRGFLVHQTMAALEARLDPALFIRLHRSAIVRRGAIERLRHDGVGVWTAILDHGAEQRISRSFVAEARRLVRA